MAHSSETIPATGADSLVCLINGSGLGLGLLIGFLIFAAYMITREAAR